MHYLRKFSLSGIDSGAFWLPKLIDLNFTLMVWGEAGEFGGKASPIDRTLDIPYSWKLGEELILVVCESE